MNARLPRNIVSPINQKVTFVELFFDLVFVFAVTQIVGLFHNGITWPAAGQAVLVFWLVWWAWTQFTWALNAADTMHPLVELGTMIATGIAFFMAVALPDAFHGRAAWFAVPYVLVRVFGLALYSWVAGAANPLHHAAVRTFSLVSTGGLAAVLAGAFVGGTMQYLLWALAILLDVLAAMLGARSENWNLHAEHFAERHGLFVIIALGETLIVAAAGFAGTEWSGSLFAVAVLAVAVTSAFWWTYFTRAKPALDHALEARQGAEQSSLARDAFSLIHFPMVCGIVAYAAALEEAIAHPHEPFALAPRLALALGVLLFTGGMAAATWRCTHTLLVPRLLIATVVVASVILLKGTAPSVSLAIVFAGVAVIAAWEHRSAPRHE